MSFVKHTASPRAAAWEAAGLDWLRVDGGARVVDTVAVDGDLLVLQRLSPASPSIADAEEFGRGLAATHAAGASAYGVGADGWEGDGYQGPADELLPLRLRPYDSWGAMYADLRLTPLLANARRSGSRRSEAGEANPRRSSSRYPRRSSSRWRSEAGEANPRRSSSRRSEAGEAYRDPFREADPLLRRLRSGEFDGSCAGPARLHGDLWSGNVVWTEDGAVLIDPAAHAGHPESDLAALALFGAPHLARILASYNEIAPLADGWRDRVPLMQLHLVLLHAVLFGGGYVEQARSILRRFA